MVHIDDPHYTIIDYPRITIKKIKNYAPRHNDIIHIQRDKKQPDLKSKTKRAQAITQLVLNLQLLIDHRCCQSFTHLISNDCHNFTDARLVKTLDHRMP